MFHQILYCDHICRDSSSVRSYWLRDGAGRHCELCGVPNTVPKGVPCALPLPVQSAHNPVLFRHASVARIAFIPSQRCSSIDAYSQVLDLHCGVVDSRGCVHHYTQEQGIQVARNGWSDAIVLNIADQQTVDAERWDKAIAGVMGEPHWWSPQRYCAADSADRSSRDCLEFAARVAEVAMDRSNVSRFEIAAWVSSLVTYLRWYAGTQHRLEVFEKARQTNDREGSQVKRYKPC